MTREKNPLKYILSVRNQIKNTIQTIDNSTQKKINTLSVKFDLNGYLIRLNKAIEALEQKPCEDAISRQAVDTLIDELARAISDERCCVSRGRSTATIMRDILHLPSVTPTRKKGKWVSKGDVYPAWKYCSKCGEPWTFDCGTPNYCPNCGTKMRGGEVENDSN